MCDDDRCKAVWNSYAASGGTTTTKDDADPTISDSVVAFVPLRSFLCDPFFISQMTSESSYALMTDDEDDAGGDMDEEMDADFDDDFDDGSDSSANPRYVLSRTSTVTSSASADDEEMDDSGRLEDKEAVARGERYLTPVNLAIAGLILREAFPFAILQNAYFKRMFSSISRAIVMPSIHAMQIYIIPYLFKRIQDQIKIAISQAGIVDLIIDVSDDNARDGLACAVVKADDRCFLYDVVFKGREKWGSERYAVLAYKCEKRVLKCGGTVRSYASDNENTMLKSRAAFARSVSVERMMRLRSKANIEATEECPIVQDIGCACHALNTVVKCFLGGEVEEKTDDDGETTEVNEVSVIVKKVKEISRAFRFGKHQEYLKQSIGRTFPQVAWTRWKTAKFVMTFLVENRAQIQAIYRNPRFAAYKNDLVEQYLNDDHFFVVLGEVMTLVSHLVKYIVYFENDSLLMSHLQPRWTAIEQFLEDARDDFVWISDTLVDKVREKLDKVYDSISCDASAIATLLDPRYRNFQLREGDMIQAKKWLKKLLGPSYAEVYSQIERFRESRFPFDGDELNEGVTDADLIEIWRDYSQVQGK
jgi:hypothetical protein